ncbi:MAG: hypothetical protein HYV13_01465 [Candidatus Doudnabacteria bacterium]|nr:hypothetical protein [Candidatus Doudnabacteria bacterium]
MNDKIAAARREVEFYRGRLDRAEGQINRGYARQELEAAQARLNALLAQTTQQQAASTSAES